MEEALNLINEYHSSSGIRYLNPVPTGEYVDENPIFDVDIVKNGTLLSRKPICVFLDQKAIIIIPT